jgi:hypothetical protein
MISFDRTGVTAKRSTMIRKNYAILCSTRILRGWSKDSYSEVRRMIGEFGNDLFRSDFVLRLNPDS